MQLHHELIVSPSIYATGEKEPEKKKSGLQWDLNLRPPRILWDALPTEL